jgi:hypothetical protein
VIHVALLMLRVSDNAAEFAGIWLFCGNALGQILAKSATELR